MKSRHEFVFVYDTKFSNPNGDPTEGNELRMIGDKLFVTDVRLKRTIRDHFDSEGRAVFVKSTANPDGTVLDGMGRLMFVLGKGKGKQDKEADLTADEKKKITAEFIDIRMFWTALKMKLTGPVQFNFGQSMHSVQQIKIEGTSVFSSGDGKSAWTFTSQYVTPYALIAFHGVANEFSAIETGLSEADIEVLKDGMWNGTKNLITRSKFEQLPRVMVDVKFKEGLRTHIGELDKYVKFVRNGSVSEGIFISDIEDGTFDFSGFAKRIADFAEKIESVEIVFDKRAKYSWLPESSAGVKIVVKTI